MLFNFGVRRVVAWDLTGFAFVTKRTKYRRYLSASCRNIGKRSARRPRDARTCNALGDSENLTRRSWENNPSVTHTCTNSEETRDFRILRRYAEIVQGEISGTDVFLLDPRDRPLWFHRSNLTRSGPARLTFAWHHDVFFSGAIIARKRELPTINGGR